MKIQLILLNTVPVILCLFRLCIKMIKTNSPITPLFKESYVQPPETAQGIKDVIILETLFGANRLFLLKYNKYVLWLSYIFSAIMGFTVVGICLTFESSGFTNFLLKQMYLIPYVVIVMNSLCSTKCRNELYTLMEIISEVDVIFRVKLDVSMKLLRVIVVLLCDFLVYGLLMRAAYVGNFLRGWYFGVIMVGMTYDVEQIFYIELLRLIKTRAALLKGHILKMYDVDGSKSWDMGPVEMLSKNTTLDLNSLHDIYAKLHKCSKLLNSILNIPYLVMYVTTMGNTITTMNLIVKLLGTGQVNVLIVTYLLCRSLKAIVILMIPCYFTTQTASQVNVMRKVLHDNICFQQYSKQYRRKLKALYKMCRECGFEYSLLGVIELNMTLPVNFIGLCVTYIVIAVQFTKVID